MQDLLRGLLKAKGSPDGSFIKDTDWIKSKYYTEYLAIMNAPQNFFKHADRDPDETIEFHAGLVPFVLLDCIRMYAKLTGRMLREGSAFTPWFVVEYPQFVVPGPFADSVRLISAESTEVRSRRLYVTLLERPEMWRGTD